MVRASHTATFIFQALSLPGPARWAMTLQVSAVGMTDSPSPSLLSRGCQPNWPPLLPKLCCPPRQPLPYIFQDLESWPRHFTFDLFDTTITLEPNSNCSRSLATTQKQPPRS